LIEISVKEDSAMGVFQNPLEKGKVEMRLIIKSTLGGFPLLT
jgi:hypothetical protein